MGNKNTKQAKKTYAPFFEKHVDSIQFKHFAENIPKGALLSFHAKQHGCFKSNTRIRLFNGGYKEISKIEIGDEVLGFDNYGNLVKSTVMNTFRNGRSDGWIRIHTNRLKNRGNSERNVEKLTCTVNHEFFTEDCSWVEAGDLSVGNTVMKTVETYVPSSEQIAIMIGLHLGDGYMSKSGNMQFCHKIEHEEYLDWKISVMSPERLNSKVYKKSGYGSDVVFNMVSCNHVYKELFENVGNNEVTDWMIQNSTPLTLAIIYMDDGNLSQNDKQKDRAAIACCSIDDQNMSKFIKLFTKYDINPVPYKDSRGYNRLRFNRDDAVKLWEIIAPYIHPKMQYKIPKEFRSNKLMDIEVGKNSFVSRPMEIVKIEKLENNFQRYDIQTTTGNYVAGNVMVHNSSARMSHTKVTDDLNRFQRFVNRFLPVFPEYKWDYVVGTRNVVLVNESKTQFPESMWHGSEKFRYDVMEMVKPYLTKGMTIYGEICGYANGKTIMPNHDISALKSKEFTKKYGKSNVYSYGCKEHEFRFHIYRITHLTESGENVDMTQKQMEQWCLERGLNTTTEVHPQIVYDGDVDKLRVLVDELTERPDVLTEDYLFPEQIGEGIIVRVDSGKTKPEFYKSKSFAFRCMEGLCEVEDPEDAS